MISRLITVNQLTSKERLSRMKRSVKSAKLLKNFFGLSGLKQTDISNKLGINKSNVSLTLCGFVLSTPVVTEILRVMYHEFNQLPSLDLLKALQKDGYNIITILNNAEISCPVEVLKNLLQK